LTRQIPDWEVPPSGGTGVVCEYRSIERAVPGLFEPSALDAAFADIELDRHHDLAGPQHCVDASIREGSRERWTDGPDAREQRASTRRL
jgi:hypothetical protein